jgi:hypothetical protein
VSSSFEKTAEGGDRFKSVPSAPSRVFCHATLRELEDAGIARLSLDLQNYGSFDLFTRDMITTDERRRNICQEI